MRADSLLRDTGRGRRRIRSRERKEREKGNNMVEEGE
jgi:hypothetical protein